MTVTIKEITEKFYEVIDRYKEHEDWWEESEIKPKIEYLIPFRNELEQVAVNYLEEPCITLREHWRWCTTAT